MGCIYDARLNLIHYEYVSPLLSALNEKDELRIIHAHRNLKSAYNISVGKIAIARDFAIVLQENGWELKLIGHNPNFRQLSGITQNKFVKLAAGFDGYMVLTDEVASLPVPKQENLNVDLKLNHFMA